MDYRDYLMYNTADNCGRHVLGMGGSLTNYIYTGNSYTSNSNFHPKHKINYDNKDQFSRMNSAKKCNENFKKVFIAFLFTTFSLMLFKKGSVSKFKTAFKNLFKKDVPYMDPNVPLIGESPSKKNKQNLFTKLFSKFKRKTNAPQNKASSSSKILQQIKESTTAKVEQTSKTTKKIKKKEKEQVIFKKYFVPKKYGKYNKRKLYFVRGLNNQHEFVTDKKINQIINNFKYKDTEKRANEILFSEQLRKLIKENRYREFIDYGDKIPSQAYSDASNSGVYKKFVELAHNLKGSFYTSFDNKIEVNEKFGSEFKEFLDKNKEKSVFAEFSNDEFDPRMLFGIDRFEDKFKKECFYPIFYTKNKGKSNEEIVNLGKFFMNKNNELYYNCPQNYN